MGALGQPIASIFIPIEMHYPDGYLIELQPPSTRYEVSKTNDHIIDVYPGDTELVTDGLIEINVQPK